MNGKPQVNVGFIGAGAFISAHHLLTARETDFIRIRGIADLNEDLLQSHKEKFPCDYVTKDYRKLLKDPEVDLIVIGTKQDTHAGLIVEALDAGKWVWCEKPMCDAPGEEEKVLAAEKRAKGRLALGFNRRFSPAITKSMEILRKLPRPWFIQYRVQSINYYKNDIKDPFYLNRSHLIYEGCHFLDLASFMMGGPPEKIFMSSDKDENELIILEYSDSSRFILTLTASVGARMLEKEMMEVFTPGGGISLRNFIDMKVRGIHGEKDYLFMPDRFPRNDLIQRWGYLAWELFTSKFAEPDLPINPNLVPIVPAQEELPFLPEIEKELLPLKDSPWQERCYFPDKGWTDAFRHFAKACLEGTCPLTADGSAGKLANDLGSALMRSAEKGMFLPFRPEKP